MDGTAVPSIQVRCPPTLVVFSLCLIGYLLWNLQSTHERLERLCYQPFILTIHIRSSFKIALLSLILEPILMSVRPLDSEIYTNNTRANWNLNIKKMNIERRTSSLRLHAILIISNPALLIARLCAFWVFDHRSRRPIAFAWNWKITWFCVATASVRFEPVWLRLPSYGNSYYHNFIHCYASHSIVLPTVT